MARNSVRSLITTSVTISLHLTTFFKQFVWMIFTKYCKMRMQNFQFGTTACYCKTNIMFSFSYCVNIMDSYLRWHCCLLALNKPHAAKFLKCFCSSNVTVCFQMSDVFALLFKSSVCLCWILKESIFSQTVFAYLRSFVFELEILEDFLWWLVIGNMLCLVMLLRETWH